MQAGRDSRPPGEPAFVVPYPSNPDFIGRDSELQQLADLLVAGKTPAIAGVGGQGKTQLATEYAHRRRAAYPGGVFWIRMEQAEAIPGALAALAGPAGLDLPGAAAMSFDDQVAAVRTAWQQPIARLLICDNCEDPALLARWRPTGGSRVLVTTRLARWPGGAGVTLVRLGGLPRPDSITLLLGPRARREGQTVAGLLAAPPPAQAADAICTEVDDLPLALTLAAAYLEDAPDDLPHYLARLRDKGIDHPAFNAGDGVLLAGTHAASIIQTIALSYTRLDDSRPHDAAARAILHLAAHCAPAPIPGHLLLRAADHDPDDPDAAESAAPALRRLTALSLLDALPAGAYRCHRLIAAYTRRLTPDPTPLYHALAAALSHELRAINAAGYPLAGRPYPAHATGLLDGLPDDPDKADLLNNLALLLQDQGDNVAARPLFERALAVTEAALGPTHPTTQRIRANLADLQTQMRLPPPPHPG